MDYLANMILEASETVTNPARALALRNLADVLEEKPEVSAVLQQCMAKKLREQGNVRHPSLKAADRIFGR